MRYLSLLSIIFFLSACHFHADILVKRDGSTLARIKFLVKNSEDLESSFKEEAPEESLDETFSSPNCKNFTAKYVGDTVDYSFEMDSIGQLDDYFRETYYCQIYFEKTDQSFLIIGEKGDSKQEKSSDDINQSVTLDFVFRFEQKIKGIEDECGGCVEKLDKRTIRIQSTYGDLISNNKENTIKVLLKK